ncbi:MAG: hypothetical protein EP329_10015 [Deltaproteobacteria bacterium]|nr:MAG: hypothetical protein EP329_10015 [Deltaproteobacteria bacterium]
MSRFVAVVLASLALTGLAACQRDASRPVAASAHLAVAVQPLSLAGIGDADYTLQVYNGDPAGGGELVAEAAHITSERYGDGAGSLSYVMPCDPSSGTSYVRLVLNGLTDSDGAPVDPGTYRNPTPLLKPVTCVEGVDTPVELNLTVARDATQGFFDVAVSITDSFCAAKYDCLGGDGDPLTLLHDPLTGERSTTMVLAFACASGSGDATWLHMTDVYVVCADGGQTTPYWLSPAGTQGNHGPVPPLFFQTALYNGDEQLPGGDKCYWNLALGLEAAAPANCTLVVDATVSSDSWLERAGQSPADTVYPYIHYEVPFTNAEGLLACDRHALDAPDLRVSTAYTDFVGGTFAYERACGTEPGAISEAPRLGCGGDLVGLGPTDCVFSQSPSGVSVDFGGTRSTTYGLPPGLRLGGCCLNPCCQQ